MSRVKERLDHAWRTTRDTAAQLRQGYQAADIYARMRIWIVGALVADALVVVLVLAILGGRDQWVAVGLQTGFPGDMVVIHNLDDDPMRDVRVVLDGRFEATVDLIAGDQTVGLEMAREFRDDAGAIPPGDYRPNEARVEWGGYAEVHPVPVF